MMKPITYETLQGYVQTIRRRTEFVPSVALVLGSGLGGYAENMQVCAEMPYAELADFPTSTVTGHQGKFLFGYVQDVPVVVMQGRVHYYEGYDIQQVVLPIRLMGLLGAKKLLLTNAAGGINELFHPGDLMLLTDHISLFAPNPLIGANIEELGVRFPDMQQVYSEALREKAKKAAKKRGVVLQEGVYVQCTGPSYETPAEIRLMRTLGADAVGMSTVCEAIAAKHMGMEVCGISCITNMAAGILQKPLNHAEVQETADRVKDRFAALVTQVIVEMGQ